MKPLVKRPKMIRKDQHVQYNRAVKSKLKRFATNRHKYAVFLRRYAPICTSIKKCYTHQLAKKSRCYNIYIGILITFDLVESQFGYIYTQRATFLVASEAETVCLPCRLLNPYCLRLDEETVRVAVGPRKRLKLRVSHVCRCEPIMDAIIALHARIHLCGQNEET